MNDRPFVYSKEGLSFDEHRLHRFFEIMPGALSWSILIGLVAITIFKPLAACVLSIAFLFFWLLRLLYVTVFLLLSFVRLKRRENADWMRKARRADAVNTARSQQAGSVPDVTLDTLHHVVVMPVAKEPYEVIAPAVSALARQDFPLSRIIVVYAVEERAPESTKEAVERLRKEFAGTFHSFLAVMHPTGLPGEARVKGANATYAAKAAAQHLAARGIPLSQATVSCFDADTVVCPKYFSCLSYYYLVSPRRERMSYQPIPVYHNNIWDVPSFSRVMETGSSFFQLVEATNPEKLVTFSSHSMSFKALDEIGYWPVDMISDDSAIFWKAFVHYRGDYQVVPMYITLSMDANTADTVWQTAKNIYKQRRRWAYGAENFPILMRAFVRDRSIPFYQKWRHAFKMLEGHVSWATCGFLLTTMGWFPALMSRREIHDSVLSYNEPRIASVIFNIATCTLIITIFLSIAMLPKHESHDRLRDKLRHACEWALVPLVLVLLNAVPALDAQTRLMFAKYMEFWVTDKSRKN
jgi:cellulose synthase/poly-beta-1,6-N-acetylglucosamine synthase-like glycosyltransferase